MINALLITGCRMAVILGLQPK